MTNTLNTAAPVTTGLYIGGVEREAASTLGTVDPGNPGVIVGHAAAAGPDELRAPFGGMKQSGMGREQGIEGVRAYQDTRSIVPEASGAG